MNLSENIWLFVILQLVNVILSTVKSLLTVKGNKTSAVISNAVYYGYYTLIIKAIGDSDNFNIFGVSLDATLVIAVVTVLTNLLGVYVSLTLMEKFRKDKLWLLKVTIKTEEYDSLKDELIQNLIPFVTLESPWKKIRSLEVYLYDKTD